MIKQLFNGGYQTSLARLSYSFVISVYFLYISEPVLVKLNMHTYWTLDVSNQVSYLVNL